jgi:protein ImuA
MGLVESGALYGPGILEYGNPPENLLTVAAAHRRDLLWAMEEALRCRSVRLVVGEVRTGALDGVAVRRLSLAAAESGALALILRAAPPDDASTAATRWLVGAAPSSSSSGAFSISSGREGETGPPHFILHLTRNRRGVLGSWILTWSDSHGFQPATHTQPVAAPLRHRPHRAVA